MTRRGSERILRWYPATWRERYGAELLTLLEDQWGAGPIPLGHRASLAWAGLRERSHQSGLVGDAAPQAVRQRSGSLMVLVAWAGMTIAGAIVAKSAEHFAVAMPPSSRGPAQLAYDVVAIAGVLGTLLVGVGALVALPALGRLLRGGRWRHVRGGILRALGATLGTGVVTLGVSVWGHHLSGAARNGANPRYAGAAVALGVLAIVTIALWSAAAIKVALAIDLSARVLRTESALALAVGVAALFVTLGSLAWWYEVASHAPWFLQGTARGVAASPWSTHLASATVIMLVALTVASWGLSRVMSKRVAIAGRR